jgi:hypothetical protein
VIALLLITFSFSIKGKTNIKSRVETMSANEQASFGALWGTLFRVPRTTACSKSSLLRRIKRQLEEEGLLRGQRTKKKPFWWVKQWGYETAAYFFDFIDPVLQKPVVAEFQKMYKALQAFPSVDSQYSDPFDFKKLISQDNAHLSKKALKQIKLFTKNFNENVYNVSVNAVQIRQALIAWKWYMDPVNPNYPQRFVMKYDMNFDGRLNHREFLLASIWHNKQIVGSPSPLCENCYFDVVKYIDAIFLYLDCDNDGFVSAEEMWTNLPNLNRKTETFNMFAFGNSENIRTAALNDFILKHTSAKDGYISRREFRIGVLLGYWDRQTETTKIVDDDSRTLKNLRWSENNMVDIALYNYYKKKMSMGH